MPQPAIAIQIRESEDDVFPASLEKSRKEALFRLFGSECAVMDFVPAPTSPLENALETFQWCDEVIRFARSKNACAVLLPRNWNRAQGEQKDLSNSFKIAILRREAAN